LKACRIPQSELQERRADAENIQSLYQQAVHDIDELAAKVRNAGEAAEDMRTAWLWQAGRLGLLSAAHGSPHKSILICITSSTARIM
jgi:hypothetical protein